TTVAGNFLAATLGDGGLATDASLGNPKGIAFDAADNLYITDFGSGDLSDPTTFGRVRRIDRQTGIITTVAGGGTSLAGAGVARDLQLGFVTDVTLDGQGHLIIPDSTRVWKVDLATGTYVAVAGNDIGG